MEFENGISLEQVDRGVFVRQYDQSYIARKWQLSKPIVNLVQTAMPNGFIWMIRDRHPEVHARGLSGQGRAYLAFSVTTESQWSLAIDTVRKGGSDFGKAVFNGKYQEQFLRAKIPFHFEKRNPTSGHLEVARNDIFPVIKKIACFDHTPLHMNNSKIHTLGFARESDIQRDILQNWNKTPFGKKCTLIGDEVHLDEGMNSRRIDILAKDKTSGDWLVIELKRAEASIDALEQLNDYITSLPLIPKYAAGGVLGIIIAERIPKHVRLAAQKDGIAAYEISYPFTFKKVA